MSPYSAGHLAQKGVAVVGQPVLDLVAHGQAQLAQDTRLPQRQDGAPQRFLVGTRSCGVSSSAIAFGEQPRDFALAVENALALHLGGMRGQHRARSAHRGRTAATASGASPAISTRDSANARLPSEAAHRRSAAPAGGG